MHDDLTPRERLARIVAEETGDGRRIVKFLVQVAEGELHSEGFQPCHRMDSAKELVKIGLTEFSDYIHANSTPRKPRAKRTSAPDADISPEIAQAREQLAEYARELTQDGRTVIKMYAEVMEGDVRNDEGFKPHHRIAAARELIKRGFDETYTQPVPEVRPDEDPELITENSELNTEDSEPVDYVAMAKEIVGKRSTPPTTKRRKSLRLHTSPATPCGTSSDKQPEPVITEEHARIGAARFHEEDGTPETLARIQRKDPRPTRRTNRIRRPLT